VLSQRLKIKNNIDSFEVYRDLRRSNPSPYMFYIDFEELVYLRSIGANAVLIGESFMKNPDSVGAYQVACHD
jgi:anthranilate synthase component 1